MLSQHLLRRGQARPSYLQDGSRLVQTAGTGHQCFHCFNFPVWGKTQMMTLRVCAFPRQDFSRTFGGKNRSSFVDLRLLATRRRAFLKRLFTSCGGSPLHLASCCKTAWWWCKTAWEARTALQPKPRPAVRFCSSCTHWDTWG